MLFPTIRYWTLVILTLAFTTAADPGGRWSGTVASTHGDLALSLEFQNEGDQWLGLAAIGGDPTDVPGDTLDDVEIREDSLFFTAAIQTNVGGARMSFEGTVQGEAMEGEFYTETDAGLPLGRGTWSVQRVGS